ncbi:hypothetical protein R6Q59_015425 [Mikania micrantha]
MASSDNKEELLEVVLYTGGVWEENPGPVEYTRNAEYKPYNGATIEKHHFKMPVNFTYSMLRENVERAIGSPPHYLTYVLHKGVSCLPLVTFVAIGITDEYDTTHFKNHLAEQSVSNNPVEVYHSSV